MSRLIQRFDPWKSPLCTCPPKYSLNPYTGCVFSCRYCYITSYIPNGFTPRPKKKIMERLEKDLDSLEDRYPIAVAFSTDPYQPLETKYQFTREILKILREREVPTLLVTKSPLILRDIDLLLEIDVVVSMTITTLHKYKARKIEGNAPNPMARLKALEKLSRDIPTVVRIDPIIPGITDDIEDLRHIITSVSTAGAKHIVSSIYKAKPDNLKRVINAYPEFRHIYRRLYNGPRISGYIYVNPTYSKNVLSMVRREALSHGLTFNTCRDGHEYLDTRGTYCDGSHLLRNRVEW